MFLRGTGSRCSMHFTASSPGILTWYVCGVVVVSWAHFKPHSGNFPHRFFPPPLPPTSPTSPPSCDCVPGICWGANSRPSHETAMVQVGLWVPTPLAVRKGLFSCKFLARLQELCLHSSLCLLKQVSWLCLVHVTH